MTTDAAIYSPGQVFEVKFPFTRENYEGFGEDGPYTTKTWKPGVRMEQTSIDDVEAFADGEGAMILTVVSVHKPGRFPTRVFCTRRWRDPNGTEFGKTKLHIWTAEKFGRLARGYQHEYELTPLHTEGPIGHGGLTQVAAE